MLTGMNAVLPSAAAQPRTEGFPLPQRHRRLIACAAVAASIALGSLGVGATLETVQRDAVTSATAAR
jgi:hypothetical protein